jgi:hypothetical protein
VDEIQTLATGFVEDIISDREALPVIVESHEAAIRKRWLKKGTAWRSKVLLSASPDMPLHHPPDFEGFRRHGNRRLDRSITCSADAQLMPYITREDLLHDHHLLLFINSRGRNQPGLFPSTDSVKAHLGQG